MPGETIKVTGLKSTVRNLKKFDKGIITEVKASNREGAELVAATARELVPARTGRLRKSIRAGATQFTGTVRAGSSSVPYAAPIHFGWPRRNISPQPFLYDALDARRGEVLLAYETNIAKLSARCNESGDA